MLDFKDFVPKQLASAGFFKQAEYESFEDAVAAAGKWISDNNIKVTNVETVVLPNIWNRYEEGPTDPSIRTAGEMASSWHQFVRCWHQV